MKTLEQIKTEGWESGINQIWNGDCLDFMKLIPDKSIDLVLTDPPYGINMDAELNKKQGKYGYKNYGKTNWDCGIPKKEYFDEIMRVSKNQIIWGAIILLNILTLQWGGLFGIKGREILV